jgi:hypothetical protein
LFLFTTLLVTAKARRAVGPLTPPAAAFSVGDTRPRSAVGALASAVVAEVGAHARAAGWLADATAGAFARVRLTEISAIALDRHRGSAGVIVAAAPE